jgi:hypothetical protein
MDEPFGDRDEVIRQGMAEVHSALGIIGNVMMLRAGRAKPRAEKVDLAHRVMAALRRQRLRFLRYHGTLLGYGLKVLKDIRSFLFLCRIEPKHLKNISLS